MKNTLAASTNHSAVRNSAAIEKCKLSEHFATLGSMLKISMPSHSVADACRICLTAGMIKGGSINLRDIEEKEIVDGAAELLNSELPEITDLLMSGGTRSEKRIRFEVWDFLLPEGFICQECRGEYSLTLSGICYLVTLCDILGDELEYLSPAGVKLASEIASSCRELYSAAGAYMVRTRLSLT